MVGIPDLMHACGKLFSKAGNLNVELECYRNVARDSSLETNSEPSEVT